MSAPAPLPTPPRRTLVRLYGGGVALVLACLSFAAVLHIGRRQAVAAQTKVLADQAAAGRPTLVARAIEHSGPRSVSLPGDVRAFRQVTLYAKVSGYLKDIKVDKGDSVQAGQILGVVESPETDQQVLSVRADLSVKKQLQARYKQLVGKGVVSQQEMERADANLDTARAELARLMALKDYELIRAPFSGTITARYVDAGALLPAATGSTATAQPLVDVADMSIVRIFVYLGQADASYVHPGDPVLITSDDSGELSLAAAVTRTARALDPRTRTMLAEIDLDNKKGVLYPGVFVRVTLQIRLPQGLVIPSDAVVLRRGVPHVARIDDTTVHFVPVRLADNDGQWVRVLEGLSKGDRVGLHVGDALSEGAHVAPIERTPPSS